MWLGFGGEKEGACGLESVAREASLPRDGESGQEHVDLWGKSIPCPGKGKDKGSATGGHLLPEGCVGGAGEVAVYSRAGGPRGPL